MYLINLARMAKYEHDDKYLKTKFCINICNIYIYVAYIWALKTYSSMACYLNM